MCANVFFVFTAGGVDYQSDVYNVTVMAEETSVEVSIAVYNDSIVEGNETFTAALSVPAAEAALGVSVSATDGTAYVEIQDDRKQNPLHMHLIVCSPLVSSRLHPDMAYITFTDMSYRVTEGSGSVTITLLVMGPVLVEFSVVVDITGGTATGECVHTHTIQGASPWCTHVYFFVSSNVSFI